METKIEIRQASNGYERIVLAPSERMNGVHWTQSLQLLHRRGVS